MLVNQRCSQTNGQVTEARYSALIPLGQAGGFRPSECPGFGGQFITVGPAVPADSPSKNRSLGRLITEPGCVQAIREGRTHNDPLHPNPVPLTLSDMDDFWFSDIQQTGQQVAWDDPRSPFKGTLREFRPGTFSVQNSGPTTIYTDAYGRNAANAPFPGSIRQYFAGNQSSTQMYVRGATRDYAANGVHAPN